MHTGRRSRSAPYLTHCSSITALVSTHTNTHPGIRVCVHTHTSPCMTHKLHSNYCMHIQWLQPDHTRDSRYGHTQTRYIHCHAHTCTHALTHAHRRAHTRTHTHTYTHTNTHIHTQTHTHTHHMRKGSRCRIQALHETRLGTSQERSRRSSWTFNSLA